MAGIDYAKFETLADNLLGGAGRSITIKTRGATVDPAKPWDGASSTGGSSQVLTGLFLEYNRREIDGTKIQAHDKRMLVAAKQVTLDINNASRVTDGSVDYQVVGPVRTVQPGGTPLLYELQLRA